MNEFEPSLEIGLSEGMSEEETAAAIQNSEAAEKTRAEIRAQKESEDAQAEVDANQQDKPDLGDYVKDTAVGVAGGLQDTASSLITLPERVIDFFSGEMGEEAKTEEGYQTEWDDFFVNDENPIETKTWWGGLVRGVTHVGTTLAATGGLGGAGGATVQAGKAIAGAAKVSKTAAIAKSLGSSALAGARFDLVSKTSQDDNIQGMLKERLPWLDTPLATKEGDHPMMKTLKNVVEGMGIGLVFDGVYEGIKFGMNSVAGDQITNFVKSTGAAAEYKGKKVISAAEEQWKNRNKSVKYQQVQKAKEQLKTKAYGAFKNSKISDIWQGTAMSNETAKSVRKGLKDIRTKWGAEEGTAGSFLSNVEVDNIARSSKEARKTVRQVLKKAYSQNKISQLEETAKRQGKSLEELVELDVELSQRIYEGRATSDLTPQEFWADIQKNRLKAEGQDLTGAEVNYDFVRPEFADTVDLINGSLLSDIRAQSIAGR